MKFARESFESVRAAPLIRFFFFGESFERLSPLVWFCLAGILVLLIGMSSLSLRPIALLGGFVVFVYAAFLMLWLRGQF